MNNVIKFPDKFHMGKRSYRIPLYTDLDVDLVLFVINAFGETDKRVIIDDLVKMDPIEVKKCIDFAKSWGYGGLYVGNLYSYRSTDPSLLRFVANPMGVDNPKHVKEMVEKCALVVYAYGNNKKEPQWLREIVANPYCIKTTVKNIPAHPLFLPSDSVPFPYER